MATDMKKETKREIAQRYLSLHPRATTEEIARETGASERVVQRMRKAVGGTSAPEKEGITFEDGGAQGLATSVSRRIRTLDQLLESAKVDLTIWEVERHIVNKWEVAMKEEGSGGKITAVVEPLIQIKAWLRRKTAQVIGLRAALADMIADAARHPVRPAPVRYESSRGECLAEIDVPDLHYGKLCWAAETGEDMDVKISEKNFREAVARLRDAAMPHGVSRFLFPIGNDYFNVDNAARATTAGTPQDEDGRWQRTFTNGRRLLVWAVDYLREKAPVDIIVTPGNHDWERMFYLGDSLSSWFRLQKDVAIDNTPKPRKYYAWGNALLGFTHGDKEAVKDLPLTMAVERPDLWSASKYREFHLGHLHHKRVRDFQPVLEQKSVVVRHLSSLTAADAWHAGKGYRSQRAAQCFIWSKTAGCTAELTFNL